MSGWERRLGRRDNHAFSLSPVWRNLLGGQDMTCRRLLLLGVSVAGLNAGLLSSASAATCVTDVNTGFTNVVSGVAGAPGISVVTAVTPTTAAAVTGVQTTPGSFLTGASLNTTSTNVVNGVSGQTGTAVTAVTPTVGNALTSVNTTTTSGSFLTGAALTTASGNAVTNVSATTTPVGVVNNATIVNTVATNPGGTFSQNGGSDVVDATNPPGIRNVQVVSGTPTTQNVVTAVNQTTAPFLTGAT